MELPRTRQLMPLVLWRESSPSTNVELRELAAAEPDLPHGTVLATANQTAGRGRAGRDWSTPPDTALAASVLVRGFAEHGLGPGWLPLLTGSAMTAALQPFFGNRRRVGVKWPNDVHVRTEEDAAAGRPGLKLCGILCEMLPSGAPGRNGNSGAIIVGTGINLLIPEGELPTERAGSLLATGADLGEGFDDRDGESDDAPDETGPPTLDGRAGRDLADLVLSGYARELLRLIELAASDPAAARARVLRHSLTIGAEVRVHMPGGEIVDGRARELAEDGSLVVDLAPHSAPWAAAHATGGTLTVSAGDIEHLR